MKNERLIVKSLQLFFGYCKFVGYKVTAVTVVTREIKTMWGSF